MIHRLLPFVAATFALGLAGCQGGGDEPRDREREAAEITRLEEQIKSYDLLDSITNDPKAPVDPEKAKQRQAIQAQLDHLRAQVAH